MYKDKSVCVVVPAYNEETQILKVIDSMPDFVDLMVIVDDASTDGTAAVIRERAAVNRRIILLVHESNQGVGGAIATGYKRARDDGFDVTAVMAGDGQMDPEDLPRILDPIVEGQADYAKGNRLFFGDAWNMIPHYRYLGNSTLSLFTKIASGYWHLADSQSGYTAISKIALKRIDIEAIYKNYGMPNDLLIKLNHHDFRVKDVHIKPVYHIGESSGIKLSRVIPRISWILFKGFWKRLFFKYVIKDFHPLIFFYGFSFLLLSASIPLILRLIVVWAVRGDIPDINAMALIFTLISGLQTLFFGMWFDMEYNKELK
jgi:glycosyltransferase involved in cell wall biosynthesis